MLLSLLRAQRTGSRSVTTPLTCTCCLSWSDHDAREFLYIGTNQPETGSRIIPSSPHYNTARGICFLTLWREQSLIGLRKFLPPMLTPRQARGLQNEVTRPPNTRPEPTLALQASMLKSVMIVSSCGLINSGEAAFSISRVVWGVNSSLRTSPGNPPASTFFTTILTNFSSSQPFSALSSGNLFLVASSPHKVEDRPLQHQQRKPRICNPLLVLYFPHCPLHPKNTTRNRFPGNVFPLMIQTHSQLLNARSYSLISLWFFQSFSFLSSSFLPSFRPSFIPFSFVPSILPSFHPSFLLHRLFYPFWCVFCW